MPALTKPQLSLRLVDCKGSGTDAVRFVEVSVQANDVISPSCDDVIVISDAEIAGGRCVVIAATTRNEYRRNCYALTRSYVRHFVASNCILLRPINRLPAARC